LFEHKRYLQPGIPIFKKMPKLVFSESMIIQKAIKLLISILYYLTNSIYEPDSIRILLYYYNFSAVSNQIPIFVDGFLSHKIFCLFHCMLSFFWIKCHLWLIISIALINVLLHICKSNFFPWILQKNYCDKSLEFVHEYAKIFLIK